MTNFNDLEGKKVTIVTTEGETHLGTVEAGNPQALVLKVRNSSKSLLIEAANIASVEVEAAPAKKLKRHAMAQVATGRARDHLIVNHGYEFAQVEAMTEEAAKTFHDSVDHGPLGHFHKIPEAVEASE